MPASVASTRASSRRDKHKPGTVKTHVDAPSRVVDDQRDAHVAFSVKTRAIAREYILRCRSGYAMDTRCSTFDVGTKTLWRFARDCESCTRER